MLSRLKQIVKRVLYRPVVTVPVYVPVLQSNLLNGRKALITGSTNGIGKAIARACIAAGARVIVTGRTDERVAKVVAELGEMAQGLVMDVCEVDALPTKIASAGPFDILVNNAGVVDGENFGAVSSASFDRTMNTNLRGAFFVAQTVANAWIQSGTKGNILNVCSTSSLRPGDGPYALSKWGLRSMTLGFAKKLVKHGIVVNGIAPGLTSTPKFCSDASLGIDNEGNPSGRLVTEEEVANMAVVLVSSMSRMVVGDIVYMGGGAGVVTFDDI